MSSKSFLYTIGFLLIALISINSICAGTEDNEIDEFPQYNMYYGVKVYQGDRQCALVGGLCVHTSDCKVPTTNKGLCPSNSHRGVECCFELPRDRPAPCKQHMGVCRDRCPKQLMMPATDCQNGEICCVLV